MTPIPLSVLDLAPIRAGSTAARRAAQQPRPRPARRAARLPALLGRRAPQHAGHRERGDRRRDRAPRRRHVDDPGRRGRHHAAEPLAARDRRAVRHARVALPRPHRPRARPRARHRPASRRARCAATRSAADDFPRDVHGAAAPTSGPSSRASAVRAVPGAGTRGAALDPRLEPLRRRSSRPRSACRTRSPRTSRPTDLLDGARALPRASSSRRRSSTQPYAMVGVNVDRGRHRRRGAAAVHVAAAGVREPAPRPARPATSRRSTTSRRTGRRREKAQASTMLDVLGRRLARDRAGGAGAASSSRPGPTS